jgi:hypothetical protein
MIQIKQVQIMHGEVIATHKSDPLNVDYMETVQTVQRNARLSYWEAFDTPDGVVKLDRSGLITTFSVVILLDGYKE